MRSLIFYLLAGMFLAPLAAYFWVFHGELSNVQGKWGEFGSYLSGVYGSLALIIVAYTTYLTREQFRRQNEDEVFFRLFDSIQSRVESSSIKVGEVTFSGHQCLKHIAERFRDELSIEAVDLARLLLAKTPEAIDSTQYMKLFDAIGGGSSHKTFKETRSNFISRIQSAGDFNDRWEELKLYIGSGGAESEKIRDALCSMGSVNFYKIPFTDRQHHYAAALHRIIQDHGELLDGYLSTMLLVVDVARNAKNRTIYERYIQSQLSRYEVIIIFYMLIGGTTSIDGKDAMRDIGALGRLRTFDCRALMIDGPDAEQIDVELSHLFAH